jgi:formylglycine-generating enzyme required for sulfatase activity
MPIVRDETPEPTQNDLGRRLRAGRVLPVVGASLSYESLFSASLEDLAQAWAADLELPSLSRDSIGRIAQYQHYRTGDDSRMKEDYLLFLKRVLLGQARNDPTVDRKVVKELVAAIDERTFTEMAARLGYPKRDDQTHDPFLLLAGLPLSIYVTTSYHGLLEQALQLAGKAPRTAVFCWNEAAVDRMRPEHRLDPDYRPTAQAPLVFHMYGHEEYPESLVLSEDDYLWWLESNARGRGRATGDPVPRVVLAAWASSSVLFLSFQPLSLEFKAQWIGLPSAGGAQPRGTFQWTLPATEQERIYIEKYLIRGLDIYGGTGRLDVYRGSASDLLDTLWVIETKPFEPETVFVPAGPFLMGADPGEGIPGYETPQHAATLPAYRIGRFPITNRQYAEFIRSVKAQDVPKDAGWFLREPPADRLDHPVSGVSWSDAVVYCSWLSDASGRLYRLPSEAEWEKAARVPSTGSGPGHRYPWGDEWDATRANAGSTDTTAVTAHPAGASPCGCEDMLGNVQEWTRSLWGSQPGQPDFLYPYRPDDGREVADPTRLPAEARLVHRGGSYKSQPSELRCAARGSAAPDSRIPWRGFRVVMTTI